MKNQKIYRLLYCSLLLVLAVSLLTLPALAAGVDATAGDTAGDIAGAVEGIWENVSGQLKSICNNVVFPALSWVCGIGFIFALVVSIVNYKKHHTVEVGWSIALLIGLIVSLTAPAWIWTLIGA